MKLIKLLFVATLLTAIAYGGYAVIAHKDKQHDHEHKGVYYCPMHPYYTSDRPGICPICQMKLVKREASSGAVAKTDVPEGYAAITLTDAQERLIGIKTVRAERKPVVKTVSAVGAVVHNIDLYKLQTEFIDAYTQYAKIYRDYRRIQDRRRGWETHRELQTKLLEAEHDLLLLGLGYEQIEKLRQINWWEVWNQPEILMFKDNKNYWVFAQILESDLGFVDIAQEADIEIPNYHEKIKGIVRSIGGSVDPMTRSVRVIIEITDYRGELAAEMLAYATMSVELEGGLLVPREAVMDLGTRKIVFIVQEGGVFKPQKVEVGWDAGGYWAIKNGLKEGDVIVANGNFLLDSESRLQAGTTVAEKEGEGHVH